MIRIIALILVSVLTSLNLYGQNNQELVQMDKNGRLRWKSNASEAFFWGVNYATPFAHSYRQIARVGADREKVIDYDTYHLARLGINAYRVHVWDCEISDSIGNLLNNEHLRLLDYLIHKFQERGVYVFLTPIAYWGNGYPEPNEALPGFSGRFTKSNVYTEPEAIMAQERYLTQFLNHVNPYTGKAYKDDPMIIGFEICNEPGHSKPAETTAFVQKMIKTVRSTGCKKPVYYNVTQSIRLLEDFIKGGTDGVTFQWYPSGLVAGREMKGNFLPHIDKYDMPFAGEKFFQKQGRLVYEFDAADIGRSYIYPPIALSFKEAGMQWVTMFAYDAVAIAANNTDYQTHFLNLVYSPQKAIGFKIAGELFRNPEFRRDRTNEKKPFGMPGLDIDYEKDIAELFTDELFFYTNTTSTAPKDPATLKSIAGYGSSPVVSYKGRGAYFLDKISNGTWRLEVMPDAIWVRDPFSRATPRIENVVLKWNSTEMEVHLPDLGNGFIVRGINEGNNFSATASGGKFPVSPGAYILTSKSFSDDLRNAAVGKIKASEYYAPKETNHEFHFLHKAPEMVAERQPVKVCVELVSPVSKVSQVSLQIAGGFGRGVRGFGRPALIPLEKKDAFLYQTFIPDSLVTPGILSYVIRIGYESGDEVVYPGAVKGPVNSWEYFNPEAYRVRVLPAGGPVVLYSAETSDRTLSIAGASAMRNRIGFSVIPGETKMVFEPVTGDFRPFGGGQTPVAFALENFVGDPLGKVIPESHTYTVIEIRGKALEEPIVIDVTLIGKSGNAYTAQVKLTSTSDIYGVELKDLVKGKMVLLPRPYPGFLPFWYEHAVVKPFKLNEIERIQLVVPNEGNPEKPGFELSSVILK